MSPYEVDIPEFKSRHKLVCACRQMERSFSFHAEFAKKAAIFKQTRIGLFFAMPVFVLLLWIVVERLFRSLYPMWTRTIEGVAALNLMHQVQLHPRALPSPS